MQRIEALLATLILSATLSLSLGCGGGGKSIAEACQEVEERGCQNNDNDCAVLTSSSFSELVDVSGCSPQLDDLEQCFGDADDICNEMCNLEGDLLSSCLTEYCNTSQDPLCLEIAN